MNCPYIKNRKRYLLQFCTIYEFCSCFKIYSYIHFQGVFSIKKEQFIFLGNHTTFRYCQHSKLN